MVYTLIDLYLNNKTYDNITIGNFDGFHLGHQTLLNSLTQNDGKNLVIIISKCYNNLYVSSDNIYKIDKLYGDKTDILSIYVEGVYKKLSRDVFKDFIKKLNVKKIYVGEDFEFGYKRLGNPTYLNKDFEVEIIQFHKLNNQKISSTNIKNSLEIGLIEEANEMLGEAYSISGEVTKGNELGKAIGFPTMNIKTNATYLKYGTYKTRVLIKDKEYESITNVGIRPTINSNELVIETHVLKNFCQIVYGEKIKISFLSFIREEKKFSDLERLKQQINEDIKSLEE